MKDRNEQVSYDWCQYVDDVEQGLFTIRKMTVVDHIKVYSEGEAKAYCTNANKEPRT